MINMLSFVVLQEKAVTHSSSDIKDDITLTWLAPNPGVGNIYFL